MNILLIPNNDWISHPVPSQRHYRIFEFLGQTHKVYVLHFDIYGRRRKATHNPKFTRVIRPLTIHLSDPRKFYAVNLPFHFAKALGSIRKLRIDVVFGSHLAVCNLVFAISKLLKVKTVFDISDFFPASVLAYSYGSRSAVANLTYSLALQSMKQNISMADFCTTCSHQLKDYVLGVSPDKRVERVPNGVDTEIFLPSRPPEGLRKKLDLQEENLLIYVGSIESWLDFECVFKAMNLLRNERFFVQLLVIGRSIYDTEGEALIQSAIKKYDLGEQVRFIGYQPYETLPDFMNLCNVGLIPFKTNSILTKMAFPNKLLEYLACGKPVLSTSLPEVIKVGGEYVYTYDNPRSLAKQMRRVLSFEYEPLDIRKKAFNYDWKMIAENVNDILLNLIS